MKSFAEHLSEARVKHLAGHPKDHATAHAKRVEGQPSSYTVGQDGSHLVHVLHTSPLSAKARAVHVHQYSTDDEGKTTQVSVHKFPLRKHVAHYGEMFK